MKMLRGRGGGGWNRLSQGKGVESGYITKGLITRAGMARFAEISVPFKILLAKRNYAIIWQPS